MNDKGKEAAGILSDALDGLKLTAENRKLAEQYLDLSGEEDPGLLSGVRRQDFSVYGRLEREACLTWCRELREQTGAEELFLRYVRFTAAAGGVTAYYVLAEGERDLTWLFKGLSKAQAAAFRAEQYAYDAATLHQGCLSVLYSMGDRDPEVLYEAMGLCREQRDASWVLLAGAYLFCLGHSSREGLHQEEVSRLLLERLLDGFSELFGGSVLSGPEEQKLRDYVLEGGEEPSAPAEILLILRGKKVQEHPLLLFTGCAYLALGQADAFRNYLRLMALADAETGGGCFLPVCRYMADSSWFGRHMELLLDGMPVPGEKWIRWSLQHREDSVWMFLARRHPEALKEEVYRMDLWNQERMTDWILRRDPKLGRELEQEFPPEQYRIKAAEELVMNYTVCAEEAKRYLLGDASYTQIEPCIKEWRKMSGGYYGNKNERLRRLRDQAEHRQLYRRAVVLEGILMHGTYFRHYMFAPPGESVFRGELSDREIREVLSLFTEEQIPLSYALDALAGIHESCYSYSDPGPQEDFRAECVKALDQRIGEWGAEYEKAAAGGAVMTRVVCILVLDLHWQEHRDALLSCASDGAKQVQQVLLNVYKSHREWEKEILGLLGSKKLKERQMAAQVLKQWGAEAYRTEIRKALEREKNVKLSEYLRKLFGMEQESLDLAELAGKYRKGGCLQKIRWAFVRPFDQIHKKSGEEAPEEYLQAILCCYASMEVPGVPEDAVKLAAELQEAELSACMIDLFHRWLDAGAEAKKKWVLYAVSVHGGEAAIPLLYEQIRELPARSRGAMAAEAVRALAWNGSSSALLLVDQISRRFKYRQVKRAAEEAMLHAAEELGISQEELEDRIVPDTLPAKRQLKAVRDAQKLRLTQTFLSGRAWQADRWKALFAEKPVMHPFAVGLIWGVYAGDTLQETFRYMEDGTFNTMEGEAFAFPETGIIRLVHPLELSGEERAAWETQLADYEILQPIDQLSRPVYRPTEEELIGTELTRFRGKTVNALSLAGKLTGQGWYKGPVGDHGEYDTFYREDKDTRVTLAFSGCGITCENTDVVVWEAVFCRTKDHKERMIGEVEERYFSEIVLQLAAAVGPGGE